MEPINIKQFVLNLKYKNHINQIYYFEDNFISVKTTLEERSNQKNYVGFLFEAEVGLKYINQLKKYVPNFLYTYSYSECSKLIKDKNIIVKTWCNKTTNEKRMYPFIIKEAAIESISLKEFLDETDEDLLKSKLTKIMHQFNNAKFVAEKVFGEYENRNLNLDNLRIVEQEDYIQFYKLDRSKELIKNKVLKTDVILYIEDHSDCTVGKLNYNKSNKKIWGCFAHDQYLS